MIMKKMMMTMMMMMMMMNDIDDNEDMRVPYDNDGVCRLQDIAQRQFPG